jgi:hypothetical protein
MVNANERYKNMTVPFISRIETNLPLNQVHIKSTDWRFIRFDAGWKNKEKGVIA